MRDEVLLVFKTTEPHSCHSQGLGTSAHMAAKVLKTKGINARPLGVFDGYELEEVLRECSNVSYVIFYAPFIDINFLRGLCLRWPQIQFTVTIHSNVAFLQSDVFAIRIIRDGTILSREVSNFTISSNSLITVKFIHKVYFARVPWLPNLYDIQEKPTLFKGIPKTLKIGLFGAVRQLKNVLTGVGAALILNASYKPVELFINGGRVEGGENVLKAVDELIKGHKGFKFKSLPWQQWADFSNTVNSMDLLLQTSFSESFNNVTADGAVHYIPSVVGPAITWVPEDWKVSNVDDVNEVAGKGIYLLERPQAGLEGFSSLLVHNRQALNAWLEYLC
jgi:hypothetical protein